ncbi:unnamed protein product [Linum tenue]|uniref:Uncharacterized protein n=1 Tax=Linum tenue TaxID=586396 RepID=A0AAV0NQW7_9ROSI|nr:unnamed protein product [Linum tenue]
MAHNSLRHELLDSGSRWSLSGRSNENADGVRCADFPHGMKGRSSAEVWLEGDTENGGDMEGDGVKVYL